MWFCCIRYTYTLWPKKHPHFYFFNNSVNNTHTQLFNNPLSGTTQVSQYQKGKTNLDFAGARDSGWQWHQLGHMQVCTSLQTDSHANTPQLSFLQAECPSSRPTNSVNTVENDFFGFAKVKWLHLTGEVDKAVRFSCKIFTGFNVQKSLKSVNFWQSYSTNEKVDFLGGGHRVHMRLS